MNELWSSFIKRKVPGFSRRLKQKEEEVYKALDLDPATLEELDSSLSSQQEQKLFLCFFFIDFTEVLTRQPLFIDLPKEFEKLFLFFLSNLDPFFKARAKVQFIKIDVEEKELSNFLANLEKKNCLDSFHAFLHVMTQYAHDTLGETLNQSTL